MKDGVAIRVLGIRVSPLLYQNVVDSFIAEAGCPGQGILPQVGETFIVGGGSWHGALLVLGVEEGASGPGADISSGSHNDLSQLIIAIGYGQVESRQAAVFLALPIRTKSEKYCKYNRDFQQTFCHLFQLLLINQAK